MEFLTNLKYMGIGMVGIMIVMGVVIGSIILLNKFTNRPTKKDGE
ncbi:MAG: oxaloacetate decarboxylase [Clostridia bacterium]|nr:oxaloacetate decarboxylase [Clostridia bacterium]